MTVKVGEIGKKIQLAAGFDMSSNTSMGVTIVPPSGDNVAVADGRITVESGTYADADLGTLAANEWLSFLTASTDFLVAGAHTVYITYSDATQTFYSDAATITVTAVGS